MLPLHQILETLTAFAPLELAESWDNVGLLLGDHRATIRGIITCLTLTPDVAEEAIVHQAELIVSHHPLLFRPVQKLTSATAEGRLILSLIRNGIAVYSPHTAFDNAAAGINQFLADRLGLIEVQPLKASELPALAGLGTGRWGKLPKPQALQEFLQFAQTRLRSGRQSRCADEFPLMYTGQLDQTVSTVGICCGSGGELLKEAKRHGCDAFLTGETRFHTCLEAREAGVALIQAGHYGTERPSIESLAEFLQHSFPSLKVWASAVERDPLSWKGE